MKRLMDFLFLLLTFLEVTVGGLVVGLAAAPSVWVVGRIVAYSRELANDWISALLVALSLGVGYYLFGLCFLVLCVVLRQGFWLKNREGKGKFYQPAGFKIAIYNFLLNTANHFFLPAVRVTLIHIWFYRGMGCRIGKDTFVGTTRMWDVDLIEIGDNCVIGGNVAINAHTVEGMYGVMRAVKIGNNVSIGADTMILPGTVIEDNVIVGANSLVPKESHLARDSVYGGVPVKKIR
jgi:acetyltransferase-like isoleucine patch superfamily enzyme